MSTPACNHIDWPCCGCGEIEFSLPPIEEIEAIEYRRQYDEGEGLAEDAEIAAINKMEADAFHSKYECCDDTPMGQEYGDGFEQ